MSVNGKTSDVLKKGMNVVFDSGTSGLGFEKGVGEVSYLFFLSRPGLFFLSFFFCML